MSRFKAKFFLTGLFKQPYEGGIARSEELAHLLGGDKHGKVDQLGQEAISEIVSHGTIVQAICFKNLHSSEAKIMNIVFSASPAAAQRYVASAHDLSPSDYKLSIGKDFYYASCPNIARGMHEFAQSVRGYGSDQLIKSINEKGIRVLARGIHLGMLSNAVASKFNIVFSPVRYGKDSFEAMGRAKGRGYKINAAILNVDIEAEIASIIENFATENYGYKTEHDLEKAVRVNHKKLPSELKRHLQYADSVEIVEQQDDVENEWLNILSHEGDDWKFLTENDRRSFLRKNDSRLILDDLEPGRRQGIDPKDYKDHPFAKLS